MLRWLITYLVGTLRIEVRRGSFERFLNLCLESGIRLWEVRRLPDRMQVTLTVADFFALRPVARQSRCRVRILKRMGLPFVTLRLKGRPLLLLGAVGAMAALIWLGSHLWVVEVRVTGPQYLDRRAIEAVAAEAGLKPGAWRSRLDLNQVTQHLKQRIDEISWAVVRLQGTRAVIEVVEKAAVVPPNKATCVHLVARKSGVVEQVIPFQGEPLVKKGDVVRPGEYLVECALRYWAGGRPGVVPGSPLPPREQVARTLVAQASVKARIAYQEYVEYQANREILEPTGRSQSQWVLNLNGRSILIRGQNLARYEREERRSKSFSLGNWRNWTPPVELVIHEIDEVVVRLEPIPLAELEQRAREAMERRLTWLLGPTDRVITPIKTQVTEQANGFVGILVTVETLEEVSAPLEGNPPLSPAEAQPSATP